MLCPFCLMEMNFNVQTVRNQTIYTCPNSECNQQIPASYIREYHLYPTIVASAIGFREHGKTVNFASLFYTLKELNLTKYWKKFFIRALDDDSLRTIYENVNMIKEGILPDSTPKNFPIPTIVRFTGVPMHPDCNLIFYDTSGESFERATQMVQYAGFVKRARTAMFLISLSNMDDCRTEMDMLINIYINGMAELDARTKDQHLVVVYTKADEQLNLLGGFSDIEDYIRSGSIESFTQIKGYMKKMYIISRKLREFTEQKLKAQQFLNVADSNFRSLDFCMVSALGARPQGRQLLVQIIPRRILDPILWTMEKSQPFMTQCRHKWFG